MPSGNVLCISGFYNVILSILYGICGIVGPTVCVIKCLLLYLFMKHVYVNCTMYFDTIVMHNVYVDSLNCCNHM